MHTVRNYESDCIRINKEKRFTMKHNRSKKVKKIINFFVNNYKFRKPYQILLDGTFTLAALKVSLKF